MRYTLRGLEEYRSMNKKKREILWLMLPVLFLGAWGLVRPSFLNFNPLNSEPRDLREGKLRLEMESFKRLDPTPLDVAQGYTVIIQPKIWQKGDFPFDSKSIRSIAINVMQNQKLQYRVGEKWQNVDDSAEPIPWHMTAYTGEGKTDGFHGYDLPRLKFRLKSVPRNAKEVRVTGEWMSSVGISNAGCGALRGKPGWQILGASGCMAEAFEPFQITLKKPDEPFPTPVVSREHEITPLGLRWHKDMEFQYFYLHLRHKKRTDWKANASYALMNMSLKDARGRKVTVWRGKGPKRTEIDPRYWGSSSYPQESFASKMPQNEVVIPPIPISGVELGEGVETLALPLTVSGEVSDGKCWPVPFSFKVRPEKFEREELGAP